MADVLGNAHFTNFFVNQGDIEQLTLALKAYSQTEKHMTEPNPDLFFNRATIYEYLERYNEAVQDYNKAHSIDPNLGGSQKAGAIIDFFVNTASVIQSRAASKAKKNVELARSVPTRFEGELRFPSVEEQKTPMAAYAIANLASLVHGPNGGAILAAKVVMHLERPTEVPQTFLIVDSLQNFAAISIYHTNSTLKNTIKNGDLLYIKNPNYIFTSLDFRGRIYSYNSVKVAELTEILVNGSPLTAHFSENLATSNNFN